MNGKHHGDGATAYQMQSFTVTQHERYQTCIKPILE